MPSFPTVAAWVSCGFLKFPFAIAGFEGKNVNITNWIERQKLKLYLQILHWPCVFGREKYWRIPEDTFHFHGERNAWIFFVNRTCETSKMTLMAHSLRIKYLKKKHTQHRKTVNALPCKCKNISERAKYKLESTRLCSVQWTLACPSNNQHVKYKRMKWLVKANMLMLLYIVHVIRRVRKASIKLSVFSARKFCLFI